MGPYFAAIFDTIFCAHFWHNMASIWAPFHGPWVRTLRPFSTQFVAPIFGTSCQPFGHHFMDPVDTIPPPFLSLPLPLAPVPLRPLWISLPQSSALLPTTGLGSLSEWQHASSSEQGSCVRPKERNSGFDNSGEINRPSLAMPTRMCESEEKQTQCQIIG